MSKLPPLPHWCESGSPFAEQMQAYATAATEPLLQRIAELERQLEEARKDAERIDFVETQGNGMKWLARNSATGRGYRLHNDPDGRYISAREAIDAAMQKGQP